MFKTEVTTCYSLITLLRYYGKVLSPFLLRYDAITARPILSPSFLLRYYGITARYFTLLFYWHQSYCKSKCFILLSCYTITARYSTLLIGIKATVNTSVSFVSHYCAITARYFTLLSYWHQSYCKSKCFILLSCYTITARYSTLLIGIKATVNTSVSFVSHYCAITARYFTLLSYWHQSYCKSKCCILTTLLWKGTLLFFFIGIKATVKASVSSF